MAFATTGIMDEKLPKSIDLSHHLSILAKSRKPSPLKDLAKYFGKEGLISLAGGMPSAAYFPLSELSAETLTKDSFALSPTEKSHSLSWFWRLFGGGSTKERTEHLSIPKYAASKDEVSLEVALQYGTAQGLVPLQKFIRDFTQRVYQPQYDDFTIFLHAGNTAAWTMAVMTFCNPGQVFLTEEWTYPSAMSTARPLGVSPVPVEIDGEGMKSDSLRKILVEWDEEKRGAKRPHLIYTVPVGQNPTGACMGATRKKEIYDICVEYDIIIVEDDPYYFLQQNKYQPKSERTYSRPQPVAGADEEAAYIAQLAPSYLKFDYQGRVVRLDSFSKTIAPGSRLGWFTCNELFAERLERQGETSTQAPCGFGQSFVTQLLTKQWEYKGYIRWLRGLRTEYTLRRDYFVDLLLEEFAVRRVPAGLGSTNGAWTGCDVYLARSKRASRDAVDEKRAFGEKTMFTFVPPAAGMFVWLKINFELHESYRGPEDAVTLEKKLFIALAEAGVLVGPGSMFAATEEVQDPSAGHLRVSFSNAEYDALKKGVKIIREVLEEFFETV